MLLSFNLTAHFNKHFREIYLQEGSEAPKSLTVVKHQVNLSVLGGSGKLEIRNQKRDWARFCAVFAKAVSGVNDVVFMEFLTYLKPNLPESYMCFSAHFLDPRNSQSFLKKAFRFLFLILTHH